MLLVSGVSQNCRSITYKYSSRNVIQNAYSVIYIGILRNMPEYISKIHVYYGCIDPEYYMYIGTLFENICSIIYYEIGTSKYIYITNERFCNVSFWISNSVLCQWVCTDELHFNDLVADRIKGVSPWWKRVMWEYKNYGVHKTIATHTLQAQTKTLLLLSSLESGILNPKSLIPNQSNVRTPNFNPFFLNVRRQRLKGKAYFLFCC